MLPGQKKEEAGAVESPEKEIDLTLSSYVRGQTKNERPFVFQLSIIHSLVCLPAFSPAVSKEYLPFKL